VGGTEPFLDLVTAMENALDLRAHQAGTLPRLMSYPRARTAGHIGSLARLIRQAAIGAILDGTERITRGGPDAVRIDHLAEEPPTTTTRNHQPTRWILNQHTKPQTSHRGRRR